MIKFCKKIIVSLMIVGVILAPTACSKSAVENEQTAPMPVAGETGGREDKVPDPNAPVVTIVSVYTKDEGTGGIDKEMDSIDASELDANLLLQKLIEFGVIPADTTMLSFVLEDNKKATLDLSALDTSDKRTLVALANTYVENYELDAITVKVQGTATAETTDIQYNLDYEKVTSN